MHDMCDTKEMCEARKSRSSRGCRASSRDLCMRDVWKAPRPEALRAWRRVTLQVIHYHCSEVSIFEGLFLAPSSSVPGLHRFTMYLVLTRVVTARMYRDICAAILTQGGYQPTNFNFEASVGWLLM